jgi:hypothetical protein
MLLKLVQRDYAYVQSKYFKEKTMSELTTEKVIAETENFTVSINNLDMLSVTVRGRWTIPEAKKLEAALNSGLDYLSGQNKPRLILYDARELNILKIGDTATLAELAKILGGLKYDALADFGASNALVSVIKLISRVNKGLGRVRLFNTRDEAVAYLESVRDAIKSTA